METTITEAVALNYTGETTLKIDCRDAYQEIVITGVHADADLIKQIFPRVYKEDSSTKNPTAQWKKKQNTGGAIIRSTFLTRKKQWKIGIAANVSPLPDGCPFPPRIFPIPIVLDSRDVLFRIEFICKGGCELLQAAAQQTAPQPTADAADAEYREFAQAAPPPQPEKAAEVRRAPPRPAAASHPEEPGPKDRDRRVLKEGDQYLEFLLAIDLGNTRSCALLCGDVRNITHSSGMQIRKLPLAPPDSKRGDEGVFDSYVSFSRDQHRWSFTRIGKEAGMVANNLRGQKDGIGDFYLSSPKRYFWDRDENLNGWQVLDGAPQNCMTDNAIVAAELAAELGEKDVTHLSRAGILASMLFEMLERAQDYIDGRDCYLKSALPKALSHVCVTFPAGWREPARQQYEQILRAAIRVFERKRNIQGCRPITLDVSCDEAAAVLLCYLYGEVAKYSGKVNVWLREIGRCLPNGQPQARVAVIDIGGGTSDLVIANVQNIGGDSGMQLEISKLYKDGADKAGDLLLQKVTKKILSPMVARATIRESASPQVLSTYIDQLDDRLNTLLLDPRVRQLSRRFWFPLAVNFISAVNQKKDTFKVPDSGRQLMEIIREHAREWTENNEKDLGDTLNISDKDRHDFSREVRNVFRETAKIFGAAICAFDADVVILSGKTTENEEVSKIFRDSCYLPERRFIRMWNYMIGDWCSVSEGGRIKDSKYTTAIGAVLYEVLNSHFPIQAIEAGVKTETAQGLDDENCLWGIVHGESGFAVDEAILSATKHDCTISFSGHPQLLACRRFAVDNTEVAICYELRLKTFKQRLREWNDRRNQAALVNEFDIHLDESCSVPPETILLERTNNKPLRTKTISVEIRRDLADDTGTVVVIGSVNGMYADGSPVRKEDIRLLRKPRDLQLRPPVSLHLMQLADQSDRITLYVDEVTGKYEDGSLISKDDFEIRIRTSGDDMFWLDSGKI